MHTHTHTHSHILTCRLHLSFYLITASYDAMQFREVLRTGFYEMCTARDA
jgi:hypothetical protein